jgi:hypothetical protein
MTRVSRLAWKLLNYLKGLTKLNGWCRPSLRFLAGKFSRSVPTIKRWFGELFKAGMIRSERHGRKPPSYAVLIPQTDTSERSPSLFSEQEVAKEIKNYSDSSETTNAVAQDSQTPRAIPIRKPAASSQTPHPPQQEIPRQLCAGGEYDPFPPEFRSVHPPDEMPRSYRKIPLPGSQLPARPPETELSNAEYQAFCQHCWDIGLCTPSRDTALRLKRLHIGTFMGKPAWLQLPAFPFQKAPAMWLKMEREQIFLEIERLARPPKPQQPAYKDPYRLATDED